MACDICRGRVTDQRVAFTVELDDKLVVVENVPAKVCGQCGERLFSPDTVDKLQKTAWEQNANPVRVIETPVFDFNSPV